MEEGKMIEAGSGKTDKGSVSGAGQNGQMELDFPPTENEKEQEAVIEAVLFTMGQSVDLRQLAAAIGQNRETARKAVERLKARYDKSKNCGMQIIALEDSYQMCTKAKYYENLIRVAATPKKQVLTDVMLETLSIIAYKQPVTKLEIEKIRGVKSDHAVNRLIEFNLVYEVGRMDAPGRPALFATTEEFLRRFGVGSTDDLPSMNPEQVEEIKAEVEEELQLKLEDLAIQDAESADQVSGGAVTLALAEAAASVAEEPDAPGQPSTPEQMSAPVQLSASEQPSTPEQPSAPGQPSTPEQSETADDTHAAPSDAGESDQSEELELARREAEELAQEAAYAAELEAAAAAREAAEEAERR